MTKTINKEAKMSKRTTKKDCKEAFELLCKELGKSTDFFNYQKKKYNIGAWRLDYNPIYGGAIVREIINENGGLTEPVLKYRISAREFVTAIDFALKILDIYKNNQ